MTLAILLSTMLTIFLVQFCFDLILWNAEYHSEFVIPYIRSKKLIPPSTSGVASHIRIVKNFHLLVGNMDSRS